MSRPTNAEKAAKEAEDKAKADADAQAAKEANEQARAEAQLKAQQEAEEQEDSNGVVYINAAGNKVDFNGRPVK